MAQRQKLQTLLETILASDHVYFQPPTSVQMAYPCIVYQRDYANTTFADNAPYTHTKRYMVTVIDRDPDSTTVDKVAMLPRCLFSRHFVADGLNHDAYSLYF